MFDGSGDSDRWADARRDGDELAIDRQTEREQKKGRDKDKDISHVLWGFSPSFPTAGGP